MPAQQSRDISGRCYCGGVQFAIAAGTAPFWTGYCHCRDCRQAHAAPLYQYVYVEKQYFRIVEGAASLKWYTRTASLRDRLRRYFCEHCGSRVYNYLRATVRGREVELCGAFPSLFDDQETATGSTWSPAKHVHCAESIMDVSLIRDELPRFQ